MVAGEKFPGRSVPFATSFRESFKNYWVQIAGEILHSGVYRFFRHFRRRFLHLHIQVCRQTQYSINYMLISYVIGSIGC